MWGILHVALVVLTASAPAPAVTEASEAPRPTLVLMPLQSSGLHASAVDTLDELLAVAVRRLGRHNVLGKSDVESMLQLDSVENAMACDEVACAAEIGGALGAEFLVAGRVAKLGKSIIIVLKLIDAGAHSVLNSAKHKARNDENLYDAAAEESVLQLFGVKKRLPASALNAADPLRDRIPEDAWSRYVFYKAKSGTDISLQAWVDEQQKESTALFVGEIISGGVIGTALSLSTIEVGEGDDWAAMFGALGLTTLATLLVVDLLDIGSLELSEPRLPVPSASEGDAK